MAAAELAEHAGGSKTNRVLTKTFMRRRNRTLVVSLGMIAALTGLRMVHIGADTPLEAATWSRGIFVDEGYKTLSPRNLVLYGSTHWHPADNYPGWMKASPLTQWPYYAAFRFMGPELESARLVTVGWFLLFLVGFLYAGWREYDWKVMLLGLWLLGTMHTLFFFSRLALLEVPVVVFCYGLLFALRGLKVQRPWQLLALTVPISLVAFLYVKRSSLLYLLPITLGLLATVDFRQRTTVRSGLLALGLAAPIGALMYLTSGLWLSGLRSSLPNLPRTLFSNQLLESSALLMALGFICAAHFVLTDIGSLGRSPYRASLLALVVGGPLVLAFVVKQPLRMFVPVLPACALLAVEWIHARAWERKMPRRVPWYGWLACLWMLVFAVFAIAQAVNKHVLFVLPLRLGESPGLTNVSMFRFAAPLSLLVALVVLSWRRSFFGKKRVLWMVAVLCVLVSARDVYVLARFFIAPSYRSVAIAREVEAVLPPDAVVAGDYAPFFAARGRFKALYLSRSFNRPNRIEYGHPDYLLFSDTTEMFAVRDAILANPAVEIGELVYQSRYADRVVELYPLLYGVGSSEPPASEAPGEARGGAAGRSAGSVRAVTAPSTL